MTMTHSQWLSSHLSSTTGKKGETDNRMVEAASGNASCEHLNAVDGNRNSQHHDNCITHVLGLFIRIEAYDTSSSATGP